MDEGEHECFENDESSAISYSVSKKTGLLDNLFWTKMKLQKGTKLVLTV